MFDLQNELKYPKQSKPRCRLPIRKVIKYNNNNNNNMSLNTDLPTVKRKVGLYSQAESHSDCDITDSESSIDNTFTKDSSSKSISSSQDQSHHDDIRKRKDSKTPYFFLNVPIRTLVIYVLILVVCYLCFHISQNNHNDRLMQDLYDSRRLIIQEFRKSLENIQLKFKNQNVDTWRAFASQIEEVINELSQISVVILLGNETNTVTCLAHSFGHISSKALSSDNYLTLNAKNIGNDQGTIIDKLKAEIQIDRVVIIENLLTINSEAIKVLHNLCDKENPLVSKTVYIITIISSGYEGLHKDTFVEDCLTAKFSKVINLDILNPLITRIIDGPIISVLPESRMKGSKNIKECLTF